MPVVEIKHDTTGVVLFRLETSSLKEANLQGANLQGADLWNANLYGANLRNANLYGANLRNANLQGANLQGADLGGANLWRANLWRANLQEANLQGANLGGANLQGANLGGADLGRADLGRADLGGANLQGAKNAALIQAQTSIVPEVGSFQGFKQLREGAIAHLSIPAEAQRSNATGRICRASCVDILAITDRHGAPVLEGTSLYDASCIYRVGERVTCDAWDSNRWHEFGGGIHFYLTRIEAEHHN